MEFSTIHAARGREADHVIILDLDDRRHGFPCLAEDDPLIGLISSPEWRSYQHPNAEERRLFYVALTRSRKGVYLVCSRTHPYPFIRELLDAGPEIPVIGKLTPNCPSCRRGVLLPAPDGLGLRCEDWPDCG